MTKTRRALVATTMLALAATGLSPLAFSGSGGAASAHSTPTPSLFGAAPAVAARQAPDTSITTPKRARYVSFRGAALPSTADEQKLALPFFTDASFVGTVEHIDKQPLLTSWSGPLDTAYGTFVVTEAAGRYQVTASTTQGSFTMNMTGSGVYQVEEVDQPHPTGDDEVRSAPSAAPARSRHGAHGVPAAVSTQAVLAPATTAERRKGNRGGAGGDDGSVEDILVAYTPGAAAAYGGEAGIVAEAAKNIGYTNAAYANSGVRTTARLVGVVPTATTGGIGEGIFKDLNQLTRRGDGGFDDVLKYVKRTHADDTILLVAPPPPDAAVCGVANHIRNQPASQAFAVVSTGGCTDGYYTFPHELGHNQGASHDLWTLKNSPVGQGPLDAQYRYGYGYVAPNFAFYTILAYYEQCYYVGNVDCPQLLNFSNPAVAYGGQPTGTTSRNNVAKLITKTRKRVAGHQQSVLYLRGRLAIKPAPQFHHGRVHVVFRGWINSGVHSTFQWYRNGKKIKHARGRTYLPTRRDVGKKLSVVVTGKARHYAPVAVGSGARKVKGPKKGHKRTAATTAIAQPAVATTYVVPTARVGTFF